MAEDKIKSDVVGFRLDPEDKERLKQFMEGEGKGNKEFMNLLLNTYELSKGKAKNINLIGDIEELELHTNKIHQAFINIIDKLEGQKEGIEEEKSKDLLIYKERVSNLKIENDSLIIDNSTVNDKLTLVNNDNIALKEQNNQLQGNLSDKITIIEEYKEKNDMLTGLLKQYEKYPEQIEALRGLLADSQAKDIEKGNVIRDKEYSISNLNAMIQAKDNSINELNDKHKEDLQTVKDRAEFSKDKAILELRAEFQKEVESRQSRHNADIQEYQNKYRTLLEELEKARTTPTKTKKGSATAEQTK